MTILEFITNTSNGDGYSRRLGTPHYVESAMRDYHAGRLMGTTQRHTAMRRYLSYNAVTAKHLIITNIYIHICVCVCVYVKDVLVARLFGCTSTGPKVSTNAVAAIMIAYLKCYVTTSGLLEESAEVSGSLYEIYVLYG